MDNPFGNLPVKNISGPKSATIVNKSDPGSHIVSSIPNTTITNEQLAKLNEYSKDMQFGIAGTTPIICKAEACPYYNKCPLVRANIELPIGSDCPVEVGLQKMWVHEFMKASNIDLSEAGEFTYDMLLINDLSFYQILEHRANIELSNDPKLIQEEFVGWDMDHKPIYSKNLNQIVLFKEKIHKMKMRLLQELIATRKAKSEDEKHFSKDRSSQIAELLRRVKEVKESPGSVKIIDVEHHVKTDT